MNRRNSVKSRSWPKITSTTNSIENVSGIQVSRKYQRFTHPSELKTETPRNTITIVIIERSTLRFAENPLLNKCNLSSLSFGSHQSQFSLIFILKNTKIYQLKEPCLHHLVLLVGHRCIALTVDRLALEALAPLRTYRRGRLPEFRRKFVTWWKNHQVVSVSLSIPKQGCQRVWEK